MMCRPVEDSDVVTATQDHFRRVGKVRADLARIVLQSANERHVSPTILGNTKVIERYDQMKRPTLVFEFCLAKEREASSA